MTIYIIVHRDIKDENIVIDENYVAKLVDFGSAAFIPQSNDKLFDRFNGTLHFAPPEILRGYTYRGPEAEMWSLGVLLYTLVFAANPFDGAKQTLKGVLRWPWPISPSLADLIRNMLQLDVHKRATIDEVISHPWLTKSGTIQIVPIYTSMLCSPEFPVLSKSF